MKTSCLKIFLYAVFSGFFATVATAATSLFSDYGQIQNVQNYSTNPFWTPNSPYNQRLPQPVYVQGADLTADDCFKIVQQLVSVQCMARDNCKNTTLSDIRPTVMVQLSNLPGNNYVSACSGYIDGVFESYVAQYGNNIPNRAVAFPTATTPNPNINNNNNTIQIQNPYKQEIPKWKQEIIERSNELQQLQQENGAGSQQLSATDFPKTFEDLSFSERMALKSEDYAQYKDMNAYVIPNFQNTEEWCSGKGSGTKECEKYRKQRENQQAQNTNNQTGNQNSKKRENQQAQNTTQQPKSDTPTTPVNNNQNGGNSTTPAKNDTKNEEEDYLHMKVLYGKIVPGGVTSHQCFRLTNDTQESRFPLESAILNTFTGPGCEKHCLKNLPSDKICVWANKGTVVDCNKKADGTYETIKIPVRFKDDLIDALIDISDNGKNVNGRCDRAWSDVDIIIYQGDNRLQTIRLDD